MENNIILKGNPKSNNAFHFFLYLSSFFSLAFVTYGLGVILYQIINKYFPNNIYSSLKYLNQTPIKMGIAALIIATPIFLFFSYLINKYLREGKISEDSRVRKWVTYIILFITVAVILGDLVFLVYGFLSEGFVTSFLLKVLVIFALSGAVFLFYFWDIQKKNMVGKKFLGNKIAFIMATLTVLIVLLVSFSVVDNPFIAQDKKIDAQTVSYLYSLNNSVISYYRKNSALPNNLDEVKANYDYINQGIRNEVSYQRVNHKEYRLCANFRRSNLNDEERSYYKDWMHGGGVVCFSRRVDVPPVY